MDDFTETGWGNLEGEDPLSHAGNIPMPHSVLDDAAAAAGLPSARMRPSAQAPSASLQAMLETPSKQAATALTPAPHPFSALPGASPETSPGTSGQQLTGGGSPAAMAPLAGPGVGLAGGSAPKPPPSAAGRPPPEAGIAAAGA